MTDKFQAVRGFNDVLPEDTLVWQRIEDELRSLFDSYGYGEIRLPILEQTELFKRSIGEITDIVEKEMYTFRDRKGKSLTLRPEATASCVRAGINHGMFHNTTQKLWYAGPMFRYERPQKGRYRQFYQVGCEAVGFGGPDIDAEMIFLPARLWKALGINDIRLELNSLGTPASRQKYKQVLVDYFNDQRDSLDADSKRRLENNPLRILDSKNSEMVETINAAPNILDYLDNESREHFDELRELLDAAGIAYRVNPRLVRGLDYYSRTVFEWLTDSLGAQDAVLSGGRYDGLVELLGGKSTPAVGWAMGVERLVELARLSGADGRNIDPHVYVVAPSAAARRAGQVLAEELRDQLDNIRVAVDYSGAGVKAQMKRADQSGARFALVLGDSEVAAAQAGLKPLRDEGEQQTLPWAELADALRHKLESN